MNHQDIEQFFSRARSIRLSEEAKAIGRAAIVARMNPVAHPSRPGARFAWFGQSWLRAGAFATLLLLIGGTALAAEGALPGDALYAWKTKVNEPARLAFLPTPIARAEWSMELMTRRLNEAEKLAADGRLTNETHVFLEDRLNEEWQRADSYGEPENDEWCKELEAEIEKRLESAQHVEVRKDAGRLRIWVRDEDEEEESEEEKRRENEVRHEGGWIEETELHEGQHEIENENDDERESQSLKSSVESKDSVKKSSESKTESISTKTAVTTSAPTKTETATNDTDSDEEEGEADEEDSTADDDELISESTARSKALAAVPGTVTESELQDEDDDPVWEVKIRQSSDNEEVKVIVDARSGSIEEIED